MTMVDVNEQFAAERADQLARAADRVGYLERETEAGRMRKNPNGSYTVLGDGWDRGEVFNTQGLPDHGLETLQDGSVAGYLNGQPAWWSLGTKIPSTAKTTTQILQFAGLDFEVGIKPTPYHFDDGRVGVSPGSFQTYVKPSERHMERVLGQVGKVFTPIQPRETFGMLDELTRYANVETAGLFKDYRRMFVTARLPEDLTIDPAGIADTIRQYVALFDAWDGSTNLSAHVEPWRVVCKNTSDFAIRDAVTSFKIRHTKTWADKAEEAKRVLGITKGYYEAFAKDATLLVQTPFAANQVDALIDQVYGEADSDLKGRALTMRTNLVDNVHKWWEVETERVGANAWAAVNAITGTADHDRNFRQSKASAKLTPLQALGEAVFTEANVEPKRRAHKALLQMATNR
jgi:phage/plasmid-like protein (TIGR03299 family)